MKRKNPIEKKLPDIAKIVLRIAKKQGMNQVALAQKCGWLKSTITRLFGIRNWTIADLLLIGNIIKTDLLAYYYDTPPEGMVPAATVEAVKKELDEAKAQLKAKEEENLKLSIENKVLREMMDRK